MSHETSPCKPDIPLAQPIGAADAGFAFQFLIRESVARTADHHR